MGLSGSKPFFLTYLAETYHHLQAILYAYPTPNLRFQGYHAQARDF